MSFKPFFIHSHHQPGHLPNRYARGFTMHISPHDDPRMVKASMAWCSPKDQFCKRDGRSFALNGEVEVVNKRAIPAILAEADKICNLSKTHESDWYYILKHMI